ncbi:MAG: ABC transporter permease subunit [Candidatus Accumulibacter sp.]|jgi:ABC-type spermidine/putrescine transport system, permease component I|nr:ABC transporter permease subunit [Accumulibacter sp.]MBN8516016.1 ABC transporter permease subunit [Accumulibacter sp.]MBO3704345.1 ABC transporter permease subunit [Accumulibacter sp.]MQM33045.1 putrescine ABC transporter permease PotH [Candidatus Accumulibacter phosphatis]
MRSGDATPSAAGRFAGRSRRLLAAIGGLPLCRRTQERLTRWGMSGRTAVIALPYLWLLLFFVIPFVIVLKISFSETQIAMPPYQPLLQWAGERLADIRLNVNFGNFLYLFEDRLYLLALVNSLQVATVSTLLALLIGYPLAYAIARSDPRWRGILLMLVILPFWTSFLLRVYAWIGILKNNGLLNNFLLWLGVIDQPIVMLQTDFATYLGIVYCYLPFMVMPLYANLEKMDVTLLEAAEDLGCRPLRAFASITLPLSLPGVVAGCMLVFIPAVGEYVIPALLGPSDSLMIGKVLWTEFFNNRDWPVASAVAIVLLLILVAPIMYFQRAQGRESGGRR